MVTLVTPSRLAGAGAGLLIDRVLGEPPTPLHPVAWFGTMMDRVEQKIYADDHAAGARYAVSGAIAAIAAGQLIRSTPAAVALTASGRMLRSVARDIGRQLEVGDVEAARAALPALVGRDTAALDASAIAAAVVESLAENTVDAVVAPALWAAVLGARGAIVHRAINTMDAMVGHRSPRYCRFGTASARLDDGAAYVPARVTAALVCLCRPRGARAIVATIRRDAPTHPSPNAGVAEAAFAAALGLELGGPLCYASMIDNRPTLGRGRRAVATDIERAVALADRVELVAVALLVTAGALARSITRARRR